MTQDQILYQFGENSALIFSLMQWWLGVSAGLFAALQFYAGKLTSWLAGFVLYAGLGLCTHLLAILTKASIW